MSRLLCLIALVWAGAIIGGCGGGEEAADQPTFVGKKPEVKDAPDGATAPGDARPSQADESRDGG